ncbi:MAG: DUF3793 family protein [Lachnospiraceae bacterium]|nr:DUF3793 family protein [Lachnospiraceae bacterium]
MVSKTGISIDTDFQNPNCIIASQCAPVFSGLKLSNLLIVEDYEKDKCESLISSALTDTDISYERLLSYKSKTVYLVYRKNNLPAYLNCKDCKALLSELGYNDISFDAIISQLKRRYTLYMYKNENVKFFPHELGLVLGYPVEDVRGFIDNSGENYIYNGYWKVYGHANEKKRLFDRYGKVTKDMLNEIANGASVRKVITSSKSGNLLFHKAI